MNNTASKYNLKCNILHKYQNNFQTHIAVRLKRKAEVAPAKPMPAGALPAPVEQVPIHVGEPKVAEGSQHPAG